ncbi:CsgG/HfaB family protein [Dokdonia sp. Hel_I_53]|uniref:CsgG/HfaB family protein n=1 Tax=Dokdonia sp. Hel_I_53 TaxID=1566287 RepID=UPI0011A71AED|nr:CsgG/HfaB family protein [Dokdonia sp. Hel_I_53]
MRVFLRLSLMASFLLLSSCGAYFNQKFDQSPARVGEYSKSTTKLLDLPEASAPVEVAVYNFSDQTGQFKAIEGGSTFSTAVTQGGTTILIKALEDSGWFRPIERENLSNLSTERNIIRNTKQEYIKNLNPNEPPLPPLLYAGLILEGGIVSYDTNIVTGGLGVRYFGVGGSAKYRQDRITVYLRAVSTSNGEILKTVYVSKTILSQALDASFFRFVKFQRLLEAETGITQNEPVQIAVKDAIERAVHDLIMEGIIDKYWGAKEGNEVNEQLVTNYLKEKELEQGQGLYNRLYVENTSKTHITLSGGVNLIDGDLTPQKPGFMNKLSIEQQLAGKFTLGLSGSVFQLNNGDSYSNIMGSVDLNARIFLLPKDDFGPYIFGGPGMVVDLIDHPDDGLGFGMTFPKLQYGVGLQYKFSPKLSFTAFAEHNILLNDNIDFIDQGRRNDFYYNFGFGLRYGLNFKSKKKKLKQENN